MAFFDRNRASHGGVSDVVKAEDDTRHADGKFKMGPANAQRKMGDTAFQAAKDHIDCAASCARSGDEQGADFHVGMAQQYGALGAKNHLMGKYVDDTKGKLPMPVLQQQAMKKAEDDVVELMKKDPLRKDWSAWNEAHRNKEGGGQLHDAPVISGGKVNTSNPMKHEMIHDWHGGDEGASDYGMKYARVEQPGWDGKLKSTFVVTGGHSMKPGDAVHMRDDGNGTTRFGYRGGGEMGSVTHVASTPAEMKTWPKCNHNLYVLK